MSDSPPAKKKCAAGQQSESMEGTIRCTVNALSKMDVLCDQVIGPEETIGGFPWKVSVMRRNKEKVVDSLTFSIKCEMSKYSRVWSCNSSIKLIIVNQDDPKKNIPIEKSHRFSFDSEEGDSWEQEMDEIVKQTKGYYKNDSMVVEAHITVTSRSGKSFRKHTQHDFSSPSKTSDGILVVEGQEFHISKQLLAINSSYFETLFYENYKEKDEEKVAIGGITAEQFTNLLRIVYPTNESFDDWKVSVLEDILKYADIWNMTVILNSAEKHLLGDDHGFSSEELFLFADKYRLHTLYDRCMAKFETCHDIEEFRETEEYQKCSRATREELFSMHIKMSKKSPRLSFRGGRSYWGR